MSWIDVKFGRFFGAGFNLLLLIMFISSLPTVFIAGWFPLRGLQIDSNLILSVTILPLAIIGIGLWLGQLRALNHSRHTRFGSIGLVAFDSFRIGLGLYGFVAWMYWFITSGVGVGQLLVSLTLGVALGLQAVLWLHTRTVKPSTTEEPGLTESVNGTLRDYIILTKPIVLALLLVTTLAAMIVAADGMPEIGVLAWTMLGGAFSAGGASALNQYIDRIRDSKMTRTKHRPLPEGRLDTDKVIVFGVLLCIGGFYTLAIFVNLLSALLALAGMIYYVIFYSLMLKPTTTQNIVIGGGAGAIPPLVGWAAAAGELSMPAFFLFALVFFWTPPHFWALALLKRRDYARAGVPMLPVIHGPEETRWQIMLYTVQVVALTLLLPLAELGGQIYFIAALLLGGGLIFYAWRLWREGGNQLAYKMYRYSSTYLALIFAALVVDTFI